MAHCENNGMHEHEHEHNHCCEHNHNHEHHSGCDMQCACCEHEHGSNSKIEAAAICISLILLILGVISSGYLSFLLFLASAAISGTNTAKSGIKAVFKGKLDETTLMLIAVIAAFCIGEYFEGAMVAVLFKLGEMLEELAMKKSQKSIEAALDIRPDTVLLLDENGNTKEILAQNAKIGDKIVIKAGDRVGLDVIVLSGFGDIDTSAITGESVPKSVGEGDKIMSGSLSLSGFLTCEVVCEFENSTASQIIKLVKESAAKKSNTEKLVSRFARIYTPAVVAVSLLMAIVPPLFKLTSFKSSLYRALIVLVASCPCAIVISVPLAYFCAMGTASKFGAVIKGGKTVDSLAKANRVIFDKTGTLTDGELVIEDVILKGNTTKEELLTLAACCEKGSNHPIARAILSSIAPTFNATEYTEMAGRGIKCTVSGERVFCGNKRLLEEEGLFDEEITADVYVVKEGRLLGGIIFGDNLRADTFEVIKKLKNLGIKKLTLLSGDREEKTKKTAEAAKIDEYKGNLLPQNKAEYVAEIKKSGETCIFVGDGINDAPVISVADVGVSVRYGAELAAEASDVVLLSDGLLPLVNAIKTARKAKRKIHFNLIFALGVKLVAVLLGLVGITGMSSAVFADVGVTALTVLNSVSLLKKKNI